MSEPTIETLARRLDRVERENRRVKLAGAVVLAIIGTLTLMGQAARGRTIEAEKFLVRDTNGRQRAALEVDADGSLSLNFYGTDQKPRGGFSVDSSGATLLALTDKDQQARNLGQGLSGLSY